MIDIPPNFQRDLSGGRQPAIQLYVDATAMVQAGIGAGYTQQIITAGDQRLSLAFRGRAAPAGQPRRPHRL